MTEQQAVCISAKPSARASLVGVLALFPIPRDVLALAVVAARGQIVDITGDIATLCIGKADGAQPGQILDVYRAVPVSIPQKGNAPAFRRQEIGHVRIDSIVDDHFARASVIGGKVANHDIVELRPAKPSH